MKPKSKQLIKATGLQKLAYDNFCKAVITITETIPTSLFLTDSKKHNHFNVMFFDDTENTVLKAKYLFKDVTFPEPVSREDIRYDTEWESPDCKKKYKNEWKDFYMDALNHDTEIISKWLDSAFFAIKCMNNKYDFKISETRQNLVDFELASVDEMMLE